MTCRRPQRVLESHTSLKDIETPGNLIDSTTVTFSGFGGNAANVTNANVVRAKKGSCFNITVNNKRFGNDQRNLIQVIVGVSITYCSSEKQRVLRPFLSFFVSKRRAIAPVQECRRWDAAAGICVRSTVTEKPIIGLVPGSNVEEACKL